MSSLVDNNNARHMHICLQAGKIHPAAIIHCSTRAKITRYLKSIYIWVQTDPSLCFTRGILTVSLGLYLVVFWFSFSFLRVCLRHRNGLSREARPKHAKGTAHARHACWGNRISPWFRKTKLNRCKFPLLIRNRFLCERWLLLRMLLLLLLQLLILTAWQILSVVLEDVLPLTLL